MSFEFLFHAAATALFLVLVFLGLGMWGCVVRALVSLLMLGMVVAVLWNVAARR